MVGRNNNFSIGTIDFILLTLNFFFLLCALDGGLDDNHGLNQGLMFLAGATELDKDLVDQIKGLVCIHEIPRKLGYLSGVASVQKL